MIRKKRSFRSNGFTAFSFTFSCRSQLSQRYFFFELVLLFGSGDTLFKSFSNHPLSAGFNGYDGLWSTATSSVYLIQLNSATTCD